MEVPNWTNKSGINLFCCDNIELMSRYDAGYFDLAIVDPPYGIGWENKVGIRNKTIKKSWDENIPTEKYFEELFRVSKNQIIWGGNYFPLGPTKCFIFWYKHQPAPTFSDGELAWTSFEKPAMCFDYRYYGNLEGISTAKTKIHPTQKPVALYDFILNKFAQPGFKIIDTHLGSGNIGISCHYFGCELIACEKEVDFYNAAIKNIEENTIQEKVFSFKEDFIQSSLFNE